MKSQDKKKIKNLKFEAFVKSKILAMQKKKNMQCSLTSPKKNAKSKGQKRKGKDSDSTFAKSKVVITHEMWKNKGAINNFTKTKSTSKA